MLKRKTLHLMQTMPSIFNPLWRVYFPLRYRERRDEGGPRQDRKVAFQRIYNGNEWNSSESRSGDGSTLIYTAKLRRELEKLVRELKVDVLLDAPCGDFNWMSHVNLGACSYIGGDIVPDMISGLQKRHENSTRLKFALLDIVDDPIPAAKLWMCRDVLFHLPEADVLKVLRKGADADIDYFLTSNHPFVVRNTDVNPGGFRHINLLKPPYNLPAPILTIEDFVVPHPPRVMGLWSREQLHAVPALRHAHAV